MSHKNATKKLWGSFFDIVCQINGDFFPKMWGFLKKCLWGSKVGIFSGGVGILSLNLLATLKINTKIFEEVKNGKLST